MTHTAFLQQIRTYFRAVEGYIPFETDLVDFLATVRAHYDLWIRDGNYLKLATSSIDGTLLATLKEVKMCCFDHIPQRFLHKS